MQDEKWTEQLVRRIDREFKTGGKGLELELNPRNLGRAGQPLFNAGTDKCGFANRNWSRRTNVDRS